MFNGATEVKVRKDFPGDKVSLWLDRGPWLSGWAPLPPMPGAPPLLVAAMLPISHSSRASPAKKGEWSLDWGKIISLYTDSCHCFTIDVSEYHSCYKPEYRTCLALQFCYIVLGPFFVLSFSSYFSYSIFKDTGRDTIFCITHSTRKPLIIFYPGLLFLFKTKSRKKSFPSSHMHKKNYLKV